MELSTLTLGQLLASTNREIRRHAVGIYKALLKENELACLHMEQDEIKGNKRITYCVKCGKQLKIASL